MKRFFFNKPFSLFCAFCGAGFLLIGCQPVKTQQSQAPLPVLSYAELAQRYNQRIALIDQLWTSTSITIRWTDDKGESHFEQGEGPLIWRRPNDLAFAIGKLGHTRFWLGCNSRLGMWWLFDLGDKQRIAYRGNMNIPLTFNNRRRLPVPVRPDQLVRLLGITPLATDIPSTVEMKDGRYCVTFPPQTALGPLHQRLWIDARYRATRIALLNHQNQIQVDAKLDRFEPLKLQGHPPGAFPWIATTIDLTLRDPATRISLRLSNPTDGKLHHKVKDVQFDFNKLAEILKINQLRLVGPPVEQNADSLP